MALQYGKTSAKAAVEELENAILKLTQLSARTAQSQVPSSSDLYGMSTAVWTFLAYPPTQHAGFDPFRTHDQRELALEPLYPVARYFSTTSLSKDIDVLVSGFTELANRILSRSEALGPQLSAGDQRPIIAVAKLLRHTGPLKKRVAVAFGSDPNDKAIVDGQYKARRTIATHCLAGLIVAVYTAESETRRVDTHAGASRSPSLSGGGVRGQAAHELDDLVRSYDERTHGYHSIVTWNAASPPKREQLRLHLRDESANLDWFDAERYRTLVRQLTDQGAAGPAAHLVDFRLDYRRAGSKQTLDLWFSVCEFSEAAATAICSNEPEVQARVAPLFEAGDLLQFARTSPPQNTWGLVAVLDGRGAMLALRRTTAVFSNRMRWQIGLTKGLPLHDRPASSADLPDLFDTIENALTDIGLEPGDCGDPLVTWMGFDSGSRAPDGFGCLFVAITRTTLSRDEVRERREQCSNYYHKHAPTHDWIELDDTEQLASIMTTLQSDRDDRTWTKWSPLVIREIGRVYQNL